MRETVRKRTIRRSVLLFVCLSDVSYSVRGQWEKGYIYLVTSGEREGKSSYIWRGKKGNLVKSVDGKAKSSYIRGEKKGNLVTSGERKGKSSYIRGEKRVI